MPSMLPWSCRVIRRRIFQGFSARRGSASEFDSVLLNGGGEGPADPVSSSAPIGNVYRLHGHPTDVIRLTDPDEALRLAQRQQPAVVITRILQRGYSIDGVGLTRTIKSTDATRSIRVIIITSMMQWNSAPQQRRRAATDTSCFRAPRCLVAAVTRLTQQRPRPTH